MAYSATSVIVSQAFRLLKLAPVSSFDDDSDKARDAAQMYPLALKACLEAGDWSFASTLVDLPEVEQLPTGIAADPDLPYLYKLPGDFVKMQHVDNGRARWRIDGAELLRANQSGPLAIRYTANVDQEAKFPAGFQIAIAATLASYLAPIHAETTTNTEYLEGLAARQVKAALTTDRATASEQRYDGDSAGGWWGDEVCR